MVTDSQFQDLAEKIQKLYKQQQGFKLQLGKLWKQIKKVQSNGNTEKALKPVKKSVGQLDERLKGLGIEVEELSQKTQEVDSVYKRLDKMQSQINQLSDRVDRMEEVGERIPPEDLVPRLEALKEEMYQLKMKLMLQNISVP